MNNIIFFNCFLTSLSSLLFFIIPFIIITPLYMKYLLIFLSISSANYHIEDYLFNNNIYKNEKYKIISEYFDGVAIILISCAFLFYDFKTEIYLIINIFIIILYSFFKLYLNDDYIKKILYSSSYFQMIYLNNSIIIPFFIAFLNYNIYTYTYNWSFINRFLWHLFNSMCIMLSIRILFLKPKNSIFLKLNLFK